MGSAGWREKGRTRLQPEGFNSGSCVPRDIPSWHRVGWTLCPCLGYKQQLGWDRKGQDGILLLFPAPPPPSPRAPGQARALLQHGLIHVTSRLWGWEWMRSGGALGTVPASHSPARLS